MTTVTELLAEGRALGLDPVDVRVLACAAFGVNAAWLRAHDRDAASDDTASTLRLWFSRRAAGEPVAYLTGRREFFGLDLSVAPGVLIPRPDTELLVELALEVLRGDGFNSAPPSPLRPPNPPLPPPYQGGCVRDRFGAADTAASPPPLPLPCQGGGVRDRFGAADTAASTPPLPLPCPEGERSGSTSIGGAVANPPPLTRGGPGGWFSPPLTRGGRGGLRADHGGLRPPRILDLGTGSGAIALALKSQYPAAAVTAVDVSPQALAIARDNGETLQLPVRWLEGAWFAPVAGEIFDLIVSNPPYIVPADPHLGQGDLRFEPTGALVGAGDGLGDIRDIATAAPAHLLPGGWLLFEHGYDQAAACRELLAAAGFQQVQSWRDLGGIERVSGGVRI